MKRNIKVVPISFSGGNVQPEVVKDDGYMTPVPLSGNQIYFDNSDKSLISKQILLSISCMGIL